MNWINDPEARLYDLTVDMLALFGVSVPRNQKIEIKQQFKKTDVLLLIPDQNKIVIVEDKTFTSEHGNQIAHYEDEIRKSKDELGFCETDPDIITVYFKTGFFDDADKLIRDGKRVNVTIDGNTFLDTIKKYFGIWETLDSYISYLENLIDWCTEQGDFCGKYDDGEWYVRWEYISNFCGHAKSFTGGNTDYEE